MDFSFPKKERLKNKKHIEALFSNGKHLNNYPIKLIYLETTFLEDTAFKAMVIVPKKSFKSAVKRNRIKRLLRESLRLNKPLVFNNNGQSFALAILYLGKEMPDYATLSKKVIGVLQKFNNILSNEKVH
ncbi:Ribonuclease P protein component [Croceitalea dokdonensis DOKDO 023]|uniref:Ribonuclease P protein component n=1 Tax=Croceitalea dokdonensis DOKDO 023 TaxID=1300341 RepID=A0A0P7AZB1_9FLAO|nr:ribonuclease P protein component [Croceitalea dokdonensis]KPM30906.1 Ribonuclease P protein component [Croceitalea dokdonensis DOKDO 023]